MEKSDVERSDTKETKEDLLVPLIILTFLACTWLVYAYVNRTWLAAFQQVVSWFSNPTIAYASVPIMGIPWAFLSTLEILVLGVTSSYFLLSSEKDTSIKFISVLGLGFGLTGLITIILGILGNLYQIFLNIAILLSSMVFLAALLYQKKTKNKLSMKECLKPHFSFKFARPPNPKFWLPVCIVISVIFFFSFYHALLTVILHWDATVYHAAMAVIMYNDHAIPVIAGPSIGIEMSANFPPLFSALGAFFYIQIGTVEDFFLRAISPAMGLLTVLATYKIGEVLAGRKFGLISALFLALTPLFFRYSIYATSYSILTFFCTVSILFLLLAINKGDNKYWICCGLFYGFATLTSYIALYLAPFFIIALIFYFTRKKNSFKINMKKTLLLLAATVAIGGVWYLRNMILVGNPIYPNAYTVLGGINIDPLTMQTTISSIKLSATSSFFGGANVSLFDEIMIFLTYRTSFPAISLFTILGIAMLPTQNKKLWLVAVWPLSLTALVLSGISWGFPRHMVFAMPGFALLSALPIMKVLEICKNYDTTDSKNALLQIRNRLPSIRRSNIIRIGLVAILIVAFLFPSLTLVMGGKQYGENLNDAVPNDYLWFLEHPNADTWIVLNRTYPEAVAWQFMNENLKSGEKVATIENRIYYVKNCSNDYFFYLDGWESRDLYNITDPALMVQFLRDQDVKYIVDVAWAPLANYSNILPMTKYLGSPSPYFPTIMDHLGNPNIYNAGPLETPITDGSPTTISINQEGWSELQPINGVYIQSVIAGNDSARLYVGTPNLTSVNITYLDVGNDAVSVNVHNLDTKEWINGYTVIERNNTGQWRNCEFLLPESERGFAELGFHAFDENFTVSKIVATPYKSQERYALNSINSTLSLEISNATVPPTLMVYLPALNGSEKVQIRTDSFGKEIGIEVFDGLIQPWETSDWWTRHNLITRWPESIIYGQDNPSLVWNNEKYGSYTLVIVLRQVYVQNAKIDVQISIGGSS